MAGLTELILFPVSMCVDKIDKRGLWAYNKWTDEKQNQNIHGQPGQFANQGDSGK